MSNLSVICVIACFAVLIPGKLTLSTGRFSVPATDALKLVILIHRHGDRTPIETYPRDPYRNISYWPDGWGQLTIRGKRRMYELGQYLAKRYKGFLGQSPREVHIRSSGSDRCLESTALVLSGLYPPQARWKWNTNLGQNWQPFPIQTVPHDTDGMLNPMSKCKTAEKVIEDIYSSYEVQEYTNKMKSTLQYVEDNTGFPKVDLIKAEEIFDVLFNEKLNNMQLPAWVDQYVYDQLEDIATKTFVFSGMTREIQRFRAGLILSDIIDRLVRPEDKRLYIYSTHDTLISVFLSALNVYNNLAPPFGASILMEVYQNQTHEPYLKTYYLNVTESQSPYQLELPDCLRTGPDGLFRRSVCTISNFYHSVRDLIPADWEAECQNAPAISDDVINVYILTVTLFVTILVLLFFLYLFINQRRHITLYRMLPVNY